MFEPTWPIFSRVLLCLIVIPALVACNLLANEPETAITGVPVVRLASPLPNATFREGVAVNIQAMISNAGPDIDRVEIVVNGAIVADLDNPNPAGTPTFSISQSWQPTSAGQYAISVTAFRPDGSSSAAATVNVNVVAQGAQIEPTTTTPPTVAGDAGGDQEPAGGGSGGAQDQPQPTAQPTNPPPPSATPLPSATPTPSKPTATFTQGVNVRAGPSTLFNPPIGSFAAGQSTDILGRTPDSSWYKVRYFNAEGWVFSGLLTVSGDEAAIPVDPGPPVPTLTPVPPTPVPVTPTPTLNVNMVAGNIRTDQPPKCAVTFNIFVDVANQGQQASPSGTISVQDVAVRDGSVQQTTTGGFPSIPPGQTVNVGPIPLTVSTYSNEQHRIVIILDPNNQIGETNENDNRNELVYTLEKAGCP